jgi:hypothetical protein
MSIKLLAKNPLTLFANFDFLLPTPLFAHSTEQYILCLCLGDLKIFPHVLHLIN